MPLIYLVIGQRLGMPLHLVTISKHCFIRWEEPGYRLNIETTGVDKVWVTDDDTAYLESERMTADQVRGTDLRNLTNREVVAELFFARSGHWKTQGGKNEGRYCLDLSRARHLAPDNPGIEASHKAVFTFYRLNPQDTLASLKQKVGERN